MSHDITPGIHSSAGTYFSLAAFHFKFETPQRSVATKFAKYVNLCCGLASLTFNIGYLTLCHVM